MISDRPAHLIKDPSYSVIPSGPLGLDLSTVPDWVKLGMLYLGGVQPITTAMVEAAEYVVSDDPTPGELDLYRREGTRFQIISVVISVAAFRQAGEIALGIPYAISLAPGNRRDEVLSEVDVDYVRQIDLNAGLGIVEPMFWGLDPFNGDWDLWGSATSFIGQEPRPGFADTLGFVTDMYYLQLGFDPSQVCVVNLGMEEGKPLRKYLERRKRLMFSPFTNLRTRRIWGAESPIELFLLQGLLREGRSPILQMLLFEDGSTHPSIDHLWAEGLNDVPGLITEADMFFPEQRLAVFCDSTRHHRGRKAAYKDRQVSDRLAQAGIRSVRVPGSLIVHDLRAAVAAVLQAL